MRHLLSTALVALVVGAIAGATVGALAQDPASGGPAAVAPAAVSKVNADRVDGKHAVAASATLAQRKNKLVATDMQGYLPANIIKNPGVTKLTVSYVSSSFDVPAGDHAYGLATCPTGRAIAGGFAQSFYDVVFTDSAPNGDTSWGIWAINPSASARSVVVFAVCLSTKPASGLASVGKAIRPADMKGR